MIFANERLILLIGLIFPVLFAGFVCFDPRRVYARWAKAASIVVAMVGLAWGALGFLLMDPHTLHLTRHAYSMLDALKHVLSGVVLGVIFSILMARPYQKTSIGNPPADFLLQFFRSREKGDK